MRKWRFRILIGILLVPSVLVLFLLCERVRGHVSLGRYKRQLIAKGEKLTPGDMARVSSAGENGAPEIIAAIGQLKEGNVLPKAYPPRMRLTPAGRAIVCFRENQWLQDKQTNDWGPLAADLEANEAILRRIRAALEKPVLNNDVDHSQGFKMRFSHLLPPKSLTHWFGAASQFALHEGSNHDALENLIPETQLPRMLAQDRLVISELVRIAIAAIGRNGAWEALQADGWTDEDLAALQRAWEGLNFATPMVNGLEGELVFGQVCSEEMRKSNEDTFQALYGLEQYLGGEERPSWERMLRDLPGGDAVADFFKKQVYCRVWRFAWLSQDERHYLELMEQLLTITRTAAAKRSFAAAQPAISRLEERSSKKNFYDRLRYPEPQSAFLLSSVVKKAMRAETERSIVICAIALKRYFLRHQQFPSSLDSLVPEFISSAPIDYMDGKPMKYSLNPDGTFLLYSVGDDAKDDGGDAISPAGKTNLRNLWERKDFVWPRPALPEELEDYRRKPN